MKERVSIIGLGYVGLPLALITAEKGYDAWGIDINKRRIEQIEKKEVIVEDSYAKELLENTPLKISSTLKSSDIYIVCVPTPVDEKTQPDLTPILGSLEMINQVAEDGQLVIIESTIYPGMCEDTLAPVLEKSGKQIALAHCPERINPGDEVWTINKIPRVVGGTTPEATKKAHMFYNQIIEANVMPLNHIKSAEAAKVLENIFRDVNIALVNEMAQAFYRMGIDVNEVIEAAATKPFSYMAHYPGIGVGGHCIAVDPYYMIEKGRQAGFDYEFLKLARKINSNMPIYTVNLTQNILNHLGMATKGTKIGIYGLSYKPEVGDTRESPSLEIIKRLRELKEADVEIFDPYVSTMSTVKSVEELLAKSEVLIVCTAHKEIKDVDLEKMKHLKLVIDGRNCLDKERIKKLGITYRGIGRE